MIRLHILFAVAFMVAMCSLAFAVSYNHSKTSDSHTHGSSGFLWLSASS